VAPKGRWILDDTPTQAQLWERPAVRKHYDTYPDPVIVFHDGPAGRPEFYAALPGCSISAVVQAWHTEHGTFERYGVTRRAPACRRSSGTVSGGSSPNWICRVHICGAAARDGTIDYSLKRPHPWAYELDHICAVDDAPPGFDYDADENLAPSHAHCNRSRSSNKRLGRIHPASAEGRALAAAAPKPALRGNPPHTPANDAWQGYYDAQGNYYSDMPGAPCSFRTWRTFGRSA
jgi:hypothetical protein